MGTLICHDLRRRVRHLTVSLHHTHDANGEHAANNKECQISSHRCSVPCATLLFNLGADRPPPSSNPIVTREGFTVCRAAGNTNVFQALVVQTFQVPPVCEL